MPTSRTGCARCISTHDARRSEEETRRLVFVLQVVQPGLAGLMDGSVSMVFATGILIGSA
jgi:hypothetical protein